MPVGLLQEGTIKGFPGDCVSNNSSPIPGLAEALATPLGPAGLRGQFDGLCLYAIE
jgi:hypothetical protein